MELEQLRQLEAIDRCETISAAAQEMSISQSALTRSMQRLEADLGCELFDRSKNRVALNTTGRVALAHGLAVLAAVDSLRDAVKSEVQHTRSIKVGTCAPGPLWNLTARITERFPDQLLATEMLDEGEIERRLLSRAIDFGIVRHPPSFPVLHSIRLMSETLSIAVVPDDALAQLEAVTFDDLDGRDFLMLENIGCWTSLHESRMPHSRLFMQSDREVYNKLAEAGTLPVFVSDIPACEGTLANRMRVPIDDPAATTTFYLAAHQDAPPIVHDMLDWLGG